MYKTKEEAINAILKNKEGEESYNMFLFESSDFDLFRNDREVALVAIQQEAFNIEYISDELKDNKDFMFKMVESNPNYITEISERLKDDKDLTLLVLNSTEHPEYNPNYIFNRCSPNYIFERCSPSLQQDRDVILSITKNYEQLSNDSKNNLWHIISDKFNDDKEVILRLINKEPNFIKTCSARLKDDKEVALEAVSQRGVLIRVISDRLKDDKEIVLAAVKEDDEMLKYASPKIHELCKDKEPIETLKIAILHEQIQKDLSNPKESSLDFARNLSDECKQAAMEQSQQVAKPKMKMKL